jgi:hypothetical protein
MRRFDNKQFYLDMDGIRDDWDITWARAARESLISISTIERIRAGHGFNVESLMLLCDFFELWDLKKYQLKGGKDGPEADRSPASS